MKFANLQEHDTDKQFFQNVSIVPACGYSIAADEQNNFIHSLYELHTNAEYLMKYRT